MRALVAALGALTAFIVQPAAVGRAGVDPGPSTNCPRTTGIPAVVGSVISVSGSLSCYVPGAKGPFGNAINQPGSTESLPPDAKPTQDQSCRQFFNYPAKFTEDTNGGVQMQYQHFGGAFTGHALFDSDALSIGTQDAYVTDFQDGSYQPSDAANANSPLTCQTDGKFHSYCKGQIDVPECPNFVDQANAVAGAPPVPQPLFDQARGDIRGAAGTIASSPVKMAVVNTPTCFWVNNLTITNEQDLALVVAGPADASGRQIFYTYEAVIKFDRLAWHFDDGSSSEVLPPQACNAPPPQVPDQSTAHVYQQISAGHNGDDTYHVWVDEFYSVSITVSWWDFQGQHTLPVALPADLQNPSIPTPLYQQFVGQVEGVPIGSP